MGPDLIDGVGGGLLVLVLVTLMLGVAVGGVLYQREIGASLRRVARRVWPPPESPAGVPIERIARDVRRLRAEVLATPAGTPMVRRVAVWGAYDDALVAACRALEVPDTLTGLPPGVERDAERLRVEHELSAAGLRMHG